MSGMSGMSDDVRLRYVAETDLVRFFEQEHDAEALRRSRFTPRPREAFMAHWTSSVLGDSTVFVQTVTVDDDEPAGHVVAWWDEHLMLVLPGTDVTAHTAVTPAGDPPSPRR
ncbi:hypothetical protein AB5J56_16785 [Streptomyces sp. R21]|uniref:Acetyltransferase n=1 Tax=Streptomyces sp. R21 TaxID=3238627 RepID=A0AB39P791_9ACTN